MKATQSQPAARARDASEPLWEWYVLLSRLQTVLGRLWRWQCPCPHPSNCSLCFIKGGCPKVLAMPCTAKGNIGSKRAAPPDPEVSQGPLGAPPRQPGCPGTDSHLNGYHRTRNPSLGCKKRAISSVNSPEGLRLSPACHRGLLLQDLFDPLPTFRDVKSLPAQPVAQPVAVLRAGAVPRAALCRDKSPIKAFSSRHRASTATWLRPLPKTARLGLSQPVSGGIAVSHGGSWQHQLSACCHTVKGGSAWPHADPLADSPAARRTRPARMGR